MIELGKKSKIVGMKPWSTFRLYRRPNTMPKVPEGHTIVCGIEQDGTEDERMFICETFGDVQALYDEHAMGHTARITWYHTDALNNAPAVA
jgi:hypothetical protein